MGLYLFCLDSPDSGIKMGSYSSIQQQRVGILQAYILYLRYQKPKTDNPYDSALIQVDNRRLGMRLEKCILKDGDINYKEFLQVKNKVLGGLFHFIYHHDGNGCWTPFESKLILNVLKRIRRFLPKIPALSYYLDDDHRYFLEDLLETSVHMHSDIIFA